jgi:hypothetical protein
MLSHSLSTLNQRQVRTIVIVYMKKPALSILKHWIIPKTGNCKKLRREEGRAEALPIRRSA